MADPTATPPAVAAICPIREGPPDVAAPAPAPGGGGGGGAGRAAGGGGGGLETGDFLMGEAEPLLGILKE